MDYNTTAYKIENGVIINSLVVNPDSILEPGLIRREYPLGIGFVELFGDFYPPGTTLDIIEQSRETLKIKCDSELEISNIMLRDLNAAFPEKDSEGNTIIIPEAITEQKTRYINYIKYLGDLKLNVDTLSNPLQYVFKSIGEM